VVPAQEAGRRRGGKKRTWRRSVSGAHVHVEVQAAVRTLGKIRIDGLSVSLVLQQSANGDRAAHKRPSVGGGGLELTVWRLKLLHLRHCVGNRSLSDRARRPSSASHSSFKVAQLSGGFPFLRIPAKTA
jgi:hypothetical protein